MPDRTGICGGGLARDFLQDGQRGGLRFPGQGTDRGGRFCGMEGIQVITGRQNACPIFIRCSNSKHKSNNSSGTIPDRFREDSKERSTYVTQLLEDREREAEKRRRRRDHRRYMLYEGRGYAADGQPCDGAGKLALFYPCHQSGSVRRGRSLCGAGAAGTDDGQCAACQEQCIQCLQRKDVPAAGISVSAAGCLLWRRGCFCYEGHASGRKGDAGCGVERVIQGQRHHPHSGDQRSASVHYRYGMPPAFSADQAAICG